MKKNHLLSKEELLNALDLTEQNLTPLDLYGLELCEPVDLDGSGTLSDEQLKEIEQRIIETHRRHTLLRSN